MPITLNTNRFNVKNGNGYTGIGLLFADVNLEYVTPEMYGAVGDGVADDTEALQSCINGGGIIHATKTYKISSTVTLKSNITILGFGIGKVIKASGLNTHYSSFSYYSDSIENVWVDGLSFIGEKYWTGQTLSGQNNDFGIRVTNAKNFRIANCRFDDFGGCAISISGENCLIDSNIVSYSETFVGEIPNYNFGIAFTGESISIVNNVISGTIQGIISGLIAKNIIICENDIRTNANGQHGIYMEASDNVQVVNNNIHDCSLCGVKFQLGDDLEKFCGVIISDNTIVRCLDHAVLIVDLANTSINIDNSVVTGNYIDTSSNGIHMAGCDSALVANNIIKNVSSYGVRIVSTDNLCVESNEIIATNSHGINVNDSQCKNIFIKNNSIVINGTSTWYGIFLQQGINIVIDGNSLLCETSSNTKCGIRILNDSTSDIIDMIIINNFCKGFGTNYLSDNPDGITVENNYFV